MTRMDMRARPPRPLPGFVLPVMLLVLTGIARMATATADGTLLGLRAAAGFEDRARAFYAADNALSQCVREVTVHPGGLQEGFADGFSDGATGRTCALRQCRTDVAGQRVYRLAVTANGAMAGTKATVYALVTVAGGQPTWRWHATRPPCP